MGQGGAGARAQHCQQGRQQGQAGHHAQQHYQEDLEDVHSGGEPSVATLWVHSECSVVLKVVLMEM